MLEKSGNYKKTIEKTHGQIEKCECYQTEEIKCLKERKYWKEIKSIGMERSLVRAANQKTENQYYISSLEEDIELFSRIVRKH